MWWFNLFVLWSRYAADTEAGGRRFESLCPLRGRRPQVAGLRSLASGRWPQVAGLRSLGSHWTPWRTRHSEAFIWCWLMRWSARWWPWCRSWRLCAGCAAFVATCIGSAQRLSRLVGLYTRSEAQSGSFLGGSTALGWRITAVYARAPRACPTLPSHTRRVQGRCALLRCACDRACALLARHGVVVRTSAVPVRASGCIAAARFVLCL